MGGRPRGGRPENAGEPGPVWVEQQVSCAALPSAAGLVCLGCGFGSFSYVFSFSRSVTNTSSNTLHFPANPDLFSLAPTESPALETSHPGCTQDHALPSSSLLSPKLREMRQRGTANSSPIKPTDVTKNRHTQMSPFPDPTPQAGLATATASLHPTKQWL